MFVSQGWSLPTPLARTVDTLGQAAIPAFLIVLGMQMQRAGVHRVTRAQATAVGLRLVASPAVAIVLAGGIGLDGSARAAGIVEAAMPTAVITTVLGEVYDVEPSFITSVVFVTTVLSPLTLTPLLAWLLA
jgi:predicted permease